MYTYTYYAYMHVSTVEAEVECAFGQSLMSFQIRVIGADYISKMQGRLACRECQTGQKRILRAATWVCETGDVGSYNINPSSDTCLACPPSATCHYGAPLFGASKISASVEMELPDDDSSDDTVREVLAAKLGIQVLWHVIILPQARRRRSSGGHTIAFELVGDSVQMAGYYAQITAMGAVVVNQEAVGPAVSDDEVWEEDTEGQFLLRSCPRGHQLINTTDDGVLDINAQHCSTCGVTTYIIDSLHTCMPCPKGASCLDGASFVSNAQGAAWEEVRAAGGGMQRRILECPSGYSMRRIEQYPEEDDCVRCIQGFYLLQPVVWMRNETLLPQCVVCPKSATCAGGTDVQAKEDFWRLCFEYFGRFEFISEAPCAFEGEPCMFPLGVALPSGWGEQMTCRQLDPSRSHLSCARKRSQQTRDNAARARLLTCQPRSCGASNVCLQNRTGISMDTCIHVHVYMYMHMYIYTCVCIHVFFIYFYAYTSTGPLCGYCNEGYAMTTAGCSAEQCQSEKVLAPWRAVLIFLVLAMLGSCP